ncbi:MAG: STAS domain-containing protein [Oscillospiraceae bacterium]|nr:STAS domain-containing protein [Oscillospiraceae bacterium]MDD7428467.1 STAS domain-containing protein [Oscillospiraceae bacterium]MDY2848177.1 STAS domain-containing protein [Oscillospiraceae bacterium]
MGISVKEDEGRVTALLSGEIDHHNAPLLRAEIDNALERLRPEELVLDFGEVSFMDSSGIGLVIGRCKLMKDIGGRVMINNAGNSIKKVMKLAGLDMLTTIC